MRLTRRFLVKTLEGIEVNQPIRYERYYINDNLRVQKKGDIFEKENLDNDNNIVSKIKIGKEEFDKLKNESKYEIIRDSYLYLKDRKVSIKKYLFKYEGLIRAEVEFDSEKEKESYIKEEWMGKEITNTNLGFDKFLHKLSKEDFDEELKRIRLNKNE